MAYHASPRPSYERPVAIASSAAVRYLWGDPESGEVADWIYVSSAKIHALVFGLPPGGSFRHSDAYRTIFAADEVLHVLEGTLVIANPATGEVQVARRGENVFFRRDTWHHAFAHGTEHLRVLELFAPPPSTGSSGRYAQTKPNLTDLRYADDSRLGSWLGGSLAESIRVLREDEVLWRLEAGILTGLVVSTEHLTVGTIEIMPGQVGTAHAHAGDEFLYVLEGSLNVRAWVEDHDAWLEISPGDGFYAPGGSVHQYYNVTATPVRAIFGVAPMYRTAPV